MENQPPPAISKPASRLSWIVAVLFFLTCLLTYLWLTQVSAVGKKDDTIQEQAVQLRRAGFVIDSLQTQITSSLNAAAWWQQKGEREDSLRRMDNTKLTAAQSLNRYYENLIATGSLSPALAAARPSPSDPRMVASMVNATDASLRKDGTIKELATGLAGNQAKIDKLTADWQKAKGEVVRRDSILVSRKVAAIEVYTEAVKEGEGGIWPFNVKKKKVSKKIAGNIKAKLIDVKP